MRRVRASWVVVGLCLLTLALVPPLRREAGEGWRAFRWRNGPPTPPTRFLREHQLTDPTLRLGASLLEMQAPPVTGDPAVDRAAYPRSVGSALALALGAGGVLRLPRTPSPLLTYATPTWSAWPFLAGIAVFGLIALALAWVVRQGSTRVTTVWRGNLRRAVPPLLAVLAAACVVVMALAGPSRGRCVRSYAVPEMTAIRSAVGAAWERPPLPADAWRAQYPPGTALHNSAASR